MTQKKATSRKEKVTNIKSALPKRAVLKAIPDEPTKAKNIGDVLKLVRESKNESLKEIADNLRISISYLQAIESMDKNNLPEKVYTLGFVRSYAHHLGIDPKKSVAQFKSEFFTSPLNEKKLSIPKHIEKATLPTKKILWISAITLLIVLIATRYFFPPNTLTLEQEISKLLEPSKNTIKKPVASTTILPNELITPAKIDNLEIQQD